MKGPLRFGMDHGNHQSPSLGAGNRTYAVGLPDGREVFVRGDRMVTTHGTVEIWTDNQVTKWERDKLDGKRWPLEWEPLPHGSELSFALPAGSWVHAYVCEALMNEPWSINYLAEPGNKAAAVRP